MELTGIAVLASLAMAAGAVCVFIYAVKKDHFRDIEEAKYQVFWSDWDEPEEVSKVTGVLSPIFAAAAMVMSSLSVTGNSRRLN
jgi:hypothetical protein